MLFKKETTWIIVSIIFLSGCSSSSSPIQAPKFPGYLNNYDIDNRRAGKNAFSSLVLEKNEFSDYVGFSLPKNVELTFEEEWRNRNKYNFKFDMYRESKADEVLIGASVTYFGDNWKFAKSLKIKVGNVVFDVPQAGNPYRKVISGPTVQEMLPVAFTPEQILVLGEVLNGKDIKIRVLDESYTDVTLKQKELNGLKLLLQAYRYLKHNDLA